MDADKIIAEILAEVDAVLTEDANGRIRLVEVKRCPHGGPHSKPETCSQCLGVVAKRIEQAGPELFIDGVPIRDIAPDLEPNAHQPRKQRRNRGRK